MAISCAVCNKPIGRYDEYVMCRSKCSLNYHISCINIDSDGLNVMKQSGEIKKWRCGLCDSNEKTEPIILANPGKPRSKIIKSDGNNDNNDDNSEASFVEIRCKICNDTADNQSVKCNTAKCNVYIHLECFNTIAKVFLVDTKSWQCRICSEEAKTKSARGVNCVNSDTKLLQKEIECLSREKELLSKLSSEMEYTIRLQKSKLEEYEAKTVSNKNPLIPHRDETSRSSYSAVAKKLSYTNFNPSKTPVLVVKSTDRSISNVQVEKDIKSQINPGVLNININKTKLIKDGLLISCENKNSYNILKDNLVQKVGSHYSVGDPIKLSPRIKLRGVDKNSLDNPDFISHLISDNNLSASSSDIKLVTKLKNKYNFDVVLEVSSTLFSVVIKRGFLYTGWKKCYLEENFNIVRCYKCCKFGHLKKNCRYESTICPTCSGHHEKNDCKSKSQLCINCKNINDKFKLSLPTNHCASDKQCDFYKYKIEQLKNKIHYE